MATVTIARTATKAPTAPKQPRAYLATDHGYKVSLPFAPVETTIGGDADIWETLDRPGRGPLVRRSGDGLRTVAFTAVVSWQDRQTSVEGTLAGLRGIAQAGSRITLGGMSAHERGPWRMTDLTIKVTARQAGTNRITRAEVDISLLFANDVTIIPKHTGPATGGHKPTKPKPRPATRYYTMRRGDTLSGVALKFYGHASYWPRIATASHIRNTRTIKVGTRLTIPPA